jgi:hypothetical protein
MSLTTCSLAVLKTQLELKKSSSIHQVIFDKWYKLLILWKKLQDMLNKNTNASVSALKKLLVTIVS